MPDAPLSCGAVPIGDGWLVISLPEDLIRSALSMVAKMPPGARLKMNGVTFEIRRDGRRPVAEMG